MIDNCFVSVIVPIFNVEKYLNQCISSVLNQSFKAFELILVDDGSPDTCPSICDHYAKIDSRVKVVHKVNGGLSDARNTGILHAAGDYVLFLDGDDYWDDNDALGRLVSRVLVSKADITHFSYKKVYEDTGKVFNYFDVPDMPSGLCFTEQIEYLQKHGLFIASACNKLIRRSLLHGVEFETGVYSEDIVWCLDVAAKATTVDYVCENFYCYRQRARSITHVLGTKRCNDLKDAILTCFLRITSTCKALEKLFLSYTAFQYGTFVLVQAQAKDPQREAIRTLSKYKYILKHHSGNKKILYLRLGSMLLGYTAMCRLIRMVYKLTNAIR